MIKAVIGDLVEVILSDPGVPVVLESGRCSVFAKSLSISVLVDDRLTVCPFLEDGGSDPWLEDEPAT